MRTKAQEILASLNIYDMDVTRKVGSLTVGNRQRVEIAKALSMNARVLIMDEPTAAITEADVERLFSTIELLKERQVGIVYISHRLNEVFVIGDRVTVLRDGRYVHRADGGMTEDRLVGMMVGRTIDNIFPKLDVHPARSCSSARTHPRADGARCQLPDPPGRDCGHGRPIRRAAAKQLRRFSASPGSVGDHPSRAAKSRSRAPPRPCATGSPTCRRTGRAADPTLTLCENTSMTTLRRLAGHVHQPPEGTGAGPNRRSRSSASALQSLPDCRQAVGRQPTESGGGQVAGDRSARADCRRAYAASTSAPRLKSTA